MHPSVMISIAKANVPSYLVGSEFYNALSSEDTEEFSIPEESLKLTSTLTHVQDLRHLLNTLRYWGTKNNPDDLLLFLLTSRSTHYQDEVCIIMEKFELFPELLQWYYSLKELANLERKNRSRVVGTSCFPLLLKCWESNHANLAQQAQIYLDRMVSINSITKRWVLYFLSAHELDSALPSSHHNVAQLLLQIYKWNPLTDSTSFLYILPLLMFLLNSTDESVLADTCHIFALVCLWTHDFKDIVIDHGLVPRFISLQEHPNQSVQAAALLVVGNLMTGAKRYIEDVFNLLNLHLLKTLLEDPSRCVEIQQEVSWILYKLAITAADYAHAIASAGLISTVVHRLKSTGDPIIEERCAHIIACVYRTCNNDATLQEEIHEALLLCHSLGYE